MRDYSFGNFLNEQRLRTGLTQHQLGALVGVSDKAVSKWENGSSKPKSDILYKLSEILCISVDELLTCKYHTFDKKDQKGVFAMKNKIWDKAYGNLQKKYGENIPLEIINRYHTEKALLQNTDVVVYFDLIGKIVAESKNKNEIIRTRNEIGASFMAYLLGATDINPLKPHRFCKKCKNLSFLNSFEPLNETCICKEQLYYDGYDIPFESYTNTFSHNLHFGITVSSAFYDMANSAIKDFLNKNQITFNLKVDKQLSIFLITTETNCSISLCIDPNFDKYKMLEESTGTSFSNIEYFSDAVLKEFTKGATEGIPRFEFAFIKDILTQTSPNSFRDLMKASGLSLSSGVWTNNAETLINQGVSMDEIIAFKEDVFNYIYNKMLQKGFTDYGFAYRVMEDVANGVYSETGLDDDVKVILQKLEVDDWFVSCIGKIKYLFSKSDSINFVKLAATLMWYKIHYPKLFTKILV